MQYLDDLRAAMEFLNKFDPESYETAKKGFITMTNELLKISPALDIAVRQYPIGDESATKRLIHRCNELHATIAKAHQIAMYLPPKGKKKINAGKILYSMKTSDCTTDRNSGRMKTFKKDVKKLDRIRIPEKTVRVISTYEDNILKSRPDIPHSPASTSAYREPQIIHPNSGKKCAYPSCHEPVYVGTMYCRYHYEQEMYLSK